MPLSRRSRCISFAVFVLCMGGFLSPALQAHDFSAQSVVLIAADFNGDGRDDLLVQPKSGTAPVEVILTDSAAQPNILSQQWNNGFLGINWAATDVKIYAADFNGDGRADLLVQDLDMDQAWLILQDTTGGFSGISTIFSSSTSGYSWSAKEHNLVVGDFNGDGKADILMQAANPGGENVELESTGSASFRVLAKWQDGYLGERWSSHDVELYTGDFNCDGKADLFMQSKRSISIINYDVPFPIIYYRPNAYAVLFADSSGEFSAISQSWSRNDFNVDWSPETHNAIIGDFNDDCRADILLQDISGSGSTYLMTASSTGSFGALAKTLMNGDADIGWSATDNTLIAVDFSGHGGNGIYAQTAETGGANNIVFMSLLVAESSDLNNAQPPQNSGSTGSSGNTVGTIPGKFYISSNGAANYSIPISVPPGVRGLQPKLALVYNSQTGAGLAGYGWTLSGLSSITRCGKILAQDGEIQSLKFTNQDDFCLDGQKLRLVSGTNGGDGSTYRTEIDTFSQITAYISGGAGALPSSGPQWFKVRTKDGLVYLYGKTADSEVLGYGGGLYSSSCTPAVPSNPVVRVWALNQITDRSGNSVRFNYCQNSGSGEYWPVSISYANMANGASLDSVNFSYDDLGNTLQYPDTPADVRIDYRGGMAVGHARRLNGITVSSNGAVQFVYGLQYRFAASYSHLTSVTECAGSGCSVSSATPTKCSGSCYPSTIINWGFDLSTLRPWSFASTSQSSNGTIYPLAIDALGDGAEDIFYSNSAGTAWTVLAPANGKPLQKWTTSAVNFDFSATPINYFGNGKTSILQVGLSNYTQSGFSLHVETFTRGTYPNLQVNDIDLKIDMMPTVSQGSDIRKLFVADVNGDGLDDIILEGKLPNGHAGLLVYWNSQSGITTTPATLYDAGSSSLAQNAFIWLHTTRDGLRVADYDGDGRADLLVNLQNGTWQALVNDNGTTMSPFAIITGANPAYVPLMLDLNGDGLSDIAYVSNSSGNWMIAVSTGTGFDVIDTGRMAINPNAAQIVDLEGDGRQDILYPGSTDWDVYSAEYYPPHYTVVTGSYGLSAAQDTGVPVATLQNPDVSPWYPVIVGDFNGDGQTDIAGFNGSGNFIYALHGFVSNRIQSITDGLGNFIKLDYSTTTTIPSLGTSTSGCYLPGTGTDVYPMRPYAGSLYVVCSYTANSGANNGDPATYTMSYTYQDAAMDLAGRGFLGFASVKQVDSRNAIATTTTYKQSFPYIGDIVEQRVVTGSGLGTELRDTKHAYASILTSGEGYTAAWFPYIKTSAVYSYGSDSHDSLAGSLVKIVQTRNTYDNWGNPTLVTTDVNPPCGALRPWVCFSGFTSTDTFETNVIADYTEDATNWCLNLPTNITVAKAWGLGAASTVTGTSNASNASQARETIYSNDSVNCRVNSQTTVATESGMSVRKTYLYQSPQGMTDPWGNVDEIRITDDNGKLLRDTVYDYSGANGIYPTTVTQMNPDNGIDLQTRQAWDLAQGVMQSKTDMNNGLTTNWTHDGYGRRLSETEPDGTSTRWTYSACSGGCGVGGSYYVDATHYSSAGTAGAVDTTVYDSHGRVAQTAKPILGGQNSHVDTQYNQLGLVSKVSAPFVDVPLYWTTTQYDNQNRPTSIVRPASEGAPSGTATSLYYNRGYSGAAKLYAITQIVSTTVAPDAPSSETTTRISDSKGDLIEVDDAQGNTHYFVDTFGDVTQVKDAASHLISMHYDSVGHKIDITDPDMGDWSYQYDALGDLICQLDANKQPIIQDYDALGRLVTRLEPAKGAGCGATTGVLTTWVYDTAAHGAGRLSSETNGSDFTRSYSYDAHGRQSSVDTRIAGTDYQITREYDAFGLMAGMTYPDVPASGTTTSRLEVNYIYDANEILQEVVDGQDATQVYWFAPASTMDAWGHNTAEVFGNNVLTTTLYDQATGSILGVTSGVGADTGIQALQYQWDGYGNLSHRQDDHAGAPNLTETFRYDSLNRLLSSNVTGSTISVPALTLSYDVTGNITNKSGTGAYAYATGFAHRLQDLTPPAGSVVSYTYDANGSLQNTSDGEAITWTAENQPAAITVGANSETFAYDPEGQRYREYARTGSTGTTTLEIGTEMEVVTPDGGSPTYRLMIIAGGKIVAARNVQSDGTATVHYLHYDHLGSVDAITDADGKVAERMSFDAFGQRRDPATWGLLGGSGNSPAVTDRGYTGAMQLPGLNLVHMQGRVYDPRLGRFISADPRIPNLYESQNLNRYAYVDNNPLNQTDPTGFDASQVNSFGSFIVPFISGNALEPNLGIAPSMTSNDGAGAGALDIVGTNETGNVFATNSANDQFGSGVQITGVKHADGGGVSTRQATSDNMPHSPGVATGPMRPGAEPVGVPTEGVDSICISCLFILPLRVAEEIYEGAKITEDALRGKVSLRYPPNDGFAHGEGNRASLLPGQIVDRYGDAGGQYLSPQGTPASARSLAPGAENNPLNVYEVVRPFEVDAGLSAPWFDQPGNGLQFYIGPKNVQELIDSGYLRPIPGKGP